MRIVESYYNVKRGEMQTLFLVLSDYYDLGQKTFVKDLELEVERFARNLGSHAAVVKPFPPDVERTRSEVLEKPWTADQRVLLNKTPSLLIIDVDFAEFDPRKHPWVLLHLRNPKSEEGDLSRIREIFDQLSDAVRHGKILQIARDLAQTVSNQKDGLDSSWRDFLRVFSLRLSPEFFGVSIDLDVPMLANLLQRLIHFR